METRVCLDTTVLVNVLRGKDDDIIAVKELQSSSLLATTTITVFELFYGAYLRGKEQEIRGVEDILDRLYILPLTTEASSVAGKIKTRLDKKGTPLDFRDVLIGSISLQEGYALKTHNKKHFEKIEGLRLI